MVQIASIEHAQSAAMVGRDIARWGAGRTLELAFRGTETALSIANRGLGRIIGRGKQAATEAREGTRQAFLDSPSIAQKLIAKERQEYDEKIAVTQLILKTTDSPDVIKAALEEEGRLTVGVTKLLIEQGVAVDLETGRQMTNRIILGGVDPETIMFIEDNLKVEVPIGTTVVGEPGLADHMGVEEAPLHELFTIPPRPTLVQQ